MNGLIITIKLQGVLVGSTQNSSSRKMQRKVLSSPYEYEIRDAKGNGTGKFITPVGNFKAPNNFKSREESLCTRKVNITEEVVKDWLLKPPYGIKEFDWKKMNQKSKIAAHVAKFDEGSGVSFEIL
jgi:hypothetical protein